MTNLLREITSRKVFSHAIDYTAVVRERGGIESLLQILSQHAPSPAQRAQIEAHDREVVELDSLRMAAPQRATVAVLQDFDAEDATYGWLRMFSAEERREMLVTPRPVRKSLFKRPPLSGRTAVLRFVRGRVARRHGQRQRASSLASSGEDGPADPPDSASPDLVAILVSKSSLDPDSTPDRGFFVSPTLGGGGE